MAARKAHPSLNSSHRMLSDRESGQWLILHVHHHLHIPGKWPQAGVPALSVSQNNSVSDLELT